MAIFDRLDRAISRTVDKTYAMRFVCRAMASTPNGRSGLDPDRSSWIGKGVLEIVPAYDSVEIGKRNRTGHDLMTPIMGERIEMSVDCRRYPAAKTAKQRDCIETDDLRKFEIVSVQPDGLSRTVFQLTEIR